MNEPVLQQTPLQPSPGIGDAAPSERTPVALRVFGVLLMVGGLALVPQVIGVWVDMGQVFLSGSYEDDSVLTIILFVVLVAAVCYAILASAALGFRLLRGNRRRARILAESVAIALVVAFASDLMLFGVNPGLYGAHPHRGSCVGGPVAVRRARAAAAPAPHGNPRGGRGGHPRARQIG